MQSETAQSGERRVALVTGSTSGIGEAIARHLVAGGYFVILHSARSAEAGATLAAELVQARYIQADLADEAQRAALIRDVIAQAGRLDVLINNAGISGLIPHEDLMAAEPEIWHAQYEVNVVAPFRLVALCEAHLRASARSGGPGAVINISSHAGVRPKGASIPYAASKAALNHVTRLLARSLGPEIRVNAIAPGLVETPLTAGWAEARALWQDRAPMQRGADPAEIAGLVSLLLQTPYLTGEVLLADGGLNLT